MKTDLTRIGNSRGIRIPKPLIAQCGFVNTVELRVTSEGLVIAPYRTVRNGWREAFSSADYEPEMLLDTIAPNKFDEKEWKW